MLINITQGYTSCSIKKKKKKGKPSKFMISCGLEKNFLMQKL